MADAAGGANARDDGEDDVLAGDAEAERAVGPGACELGGQPDSIARNAAGDRVAVAIENERDEDLNDGGLPQAPAGFLVLAGFSGGALDCAGLVKVDLTGLAAVAPEDPEPEFVDFNDAAGVVTVVLDARMLDVSPLNFHPLRNDRTTTIATADFLRFLDAVAHRPVILRFA